MTDPTRCSRLIFASGVVAALGGCYAPADERADRDLRVGRASRGELQIDVENGLAAIQDLDDERAVLWANAPLIEVTITSGEPIAGYRLSLHNVLPSADVTSMNGPRLTLEETDLATHREVVLDLPRGETRLRVAEPRAAARRPFSFALMSDVQEAIDEVQDVFEKMNESDVAFALGAGDLTEHGEAEELHLFQRKLERLRYPYFATLGNHELGERPPVFHDLFGRGNWHFDYKGVGFTMLDSASATIEPRVYDWLDDWMAESHEGVHVVGMHIPPTEPIGLRNGSFASRNEAAKLLGRMARGGVDLTLYGHLHTYFDFENAGIEAHVSGGGGAIPEKFDGIGRHFMVFTVDPDRGVVDRQVVRVDD